MCNPCGGLLRGAYLQPPVIWTSELQTAPLKKPSQRIRGCYTPQFHPSAHRSHLRGSDIKLTNGSHPPIETTSASPSHHIHQFAMFFRGCGLADDRKFGPLLACDEFDFTLEFEQITLVIGVSALFLISVPLRLKKLLGHEEKSFTTRIYSMKLVSSGLQALQLRLTQFMLSRQSMLPFRLHPSYSGRSTR
jgi:hypothetical protein